MSLLGGNGAWSGPSGSAKETLVTVDREQVRQTYEFSRSDEFVYAACGKIETAVFRGGLSAEVTEFGREIDLDEDHQRVINKDWGEDGKEALRAILDFGYYVVRPEEHEKHPGEYRMYIVPWDKYNLQYSVSSQRRRKYSVTFLDADYPTMSIEEFRRTDRGNRSSSATFSSHSQGSSDATAQIQRNENNVGYQLMNGGRSHLIFVVHHPTTDGQLTSPIAMLRRSMLARSRLTRNETYASYWRARPLHAVEINKSFFGGAGGGGGGGTTGRETFGTGMFAEGDMKMDRDKYRFSMNEAERADLSAAIDAAAKGMQLNPDQRAAAARARSKLESANSYLEPEDPNSAVTPSHHNIVLGANQHMVQAPKPEGSSNLQHLYDHVMNLAYAIVGIPPQVINPQSTKYASDDVTVVRGWDEAIQSFHQLLGPHFEEAYSVMYANQGRQYVNSFYKAYKEERKIIERRNQELSTENLPQKELSRVLEKNGQREVSDLLKQKRKDGVRKIIAGGIRVAFSFNHTPENTLEDLRALFDLDFISEDTFCRHAIRLRGISLDEMNDEIAREKQRKEKMKRQGDGMEQELKLKSKYNDEKPEGKIQSSGGPPASKKKKT